MNDIINTDVCVIGGGICGLFVSSKLLSNNHSVILLENSNKIGGQINLYGEKSVYNIPLINKIKSKDIVDKLYQEVISNDNFTIQNNSNVIDIQKNDEKFLVRFKNNTCNKENNIFCKYIILAFGKGKMEPNKLILSNSEKYENKTLFYYIEHKDELFDKNIVLAGGGDSVIDWACELCDKSKSLTIIHRRNIERDENNQILKFKSLCEQNKITLKIPYSISKLNGEDGILTSIEVYNIENKNIENIECDYLFPFYGLKTIQNNFEIYKNLGVEFDNQKIRVNTSNNETNILNIFAVGDCCFYEGKIDNIIMGFTDGLKCFYEICKREKTDGRRWHK